MMHDCDVKYTLIIIQVLKSLQREEQTEEPIKVCVCEYYNL